MSEESNEIYLQVPLIEGEITEIQYMRALAEVALHFKPLLSIAERRRADDWFREWTTCDLAMSAQIEEAQQQGKE